MATATKASRVPTHDPALLTSKSPVSATLSAANAHWVVSTVSDRTGPKKIRADQELKAKNAAIPTGTNNRALRARS